MAFIIFYPESQLVFRTTDELVHFNQNGINDKDLVIVDEAMLDLLGLFTQNGLNIDTVFMGCKKVLSNWPHACGASISLKLKYTVDKTELFRGAFSEINSQLKADGVDMVIDLPDSILNKQHGDDFQYHIYITYQTTPEEYSNETVNKMIKGFIDVVGKPVHYDFINMLKQDLKE